MTRLRKTLTALAGLLLTSISLAPTASADGYITPVEAAYIDKYGPTAVCPVIDQFPSAAGVMGVMEGVASDGFAYDDAVDIINVSVAEYCPRHWPLLVAIGKAARRQLV